MIRLLVADDHPIFRDGLRRLVESCDDLRIVAEASNGQDVAGLCAGGTIDVILLDISMPGPGFIETVRILQACCPAVRILVLSFHPEAHYAIRALRAGAAGYLTKERSSEELVKAIRQVHAGRRYVTDTLAETLAAELTDGQEPSVDTLSDREHEVLLLLGAGTTVGEAAVELGLSPKTVSTYRTRILEKLRLSSTAELIRYAVEHKLGG